MPGTLTKVRADCVKMLLTMYPDFVSAVTIQCAIYDSFGAHTMLNYKILTCDRQCQIPKTEPLF